MEVIAWSQNLTPRAARRGRRASREQGGAAGHSDVLSIHLVLSDRTRGLIGADELALMKPTAFLVNTSRGPIVDEPALIAALRSEPDRGRRTRRLRRPSRCRPTVRC